MRQLIRSVLAVLLSGSAGVASEAEAAKATLAPVAAFIETTLNTSAGQIRQFAFDGDHGTFFASEKAPGAGDHFTLVLDRPVALKTVTVITGRPGAADALAAGTLEVSADGTSFKELVKFAGGVASAQGNGAKTQAIRIRSGGDHQHPLAVRELAIEADPPVEIFRYPVEVVVDVADAPEMKEWAEKVARICERAYPMINEELKSEGFKPRSVINMRLRNDYRGVAAAGGGRITGSVKFFKEHPDDVGAMVHETTHIVQSYRGRGNPGWLVEGVADYVRFFKYEPGKLRPLSRDRARYDGSYKVTAAFLAYLTEKYDREIVRKLNRLMREGQYKEEAFRELTGKPLKDLGEEWKASLRSQRF